MNSSQLKAMQDYPKLVAQAKMLLGITEPMKKGRFREDDDFGFMSMSYFFKQRDHLNAILCLETRIDTVLIARSILEGLCQILWANSNRSELGLRWRAYSCIYNWRLLQKRIADNQVIPTDDRERIYKYVEIYGSLFHTRKAKMAIEKKTSLPSDPYVHNWSGKSARKIFETVKGSLMYSELYSPFSDWHHWNASGFGTAIQSNGSGLKYQSHNLNEAATSVAVGIQCLLQTADITNEYHKCDLNDALSGFTEDYLKLFSE